MKKLILAAAIVAIALTGCKKDKEPNEVFYTVTFNTEGGTTVQSQNVEKGGVATEPANPAKTGYVFLFWHLSGATTAYNFQTPVNSDITLTAKWQDEATAEYWQVTWTLNGGAFPANSNHATQVVKGGALAEPNEPTKTGSEFDGWYKEAALTNKATFPLSVTADITLYAKWTTEEGGNGGDLNHNIGSAAEWNTAIAAVNTAGSNKTHTFNITKSFDLQGRTNSIFNDELTGLTVTIKGQGIPAPEIRLASSSTGNLICLDAHSLRPQKIILENVILKGHATNNRPVIDIGFGGELVMEEGSLITGNTNSGAQGGGVRVLGKLIIKGGEISGNIAGVSSNNTGRGGGVYLSDLSELIMESGSISGNLAYGQGGAVYIGFSAEFYMKGGDILGNTARATSSGARGGGVYNSYGYFYMSGGLITGYNWEHGNDIDGLEHFNLSHRDACNVVIITVTAVGNYGAALYSQVGDNNFYGVFEGETFTQTGSFGSGSDRDIGVVDGVRLNRFDVNGETYTITRGGMDYWGNYFNAATDNIFLGLTTGNNEWIALDMLVPNGNNRLVAGTYTFSTATGASIAAYTFVDNNYTSYIQDADNNKLKITGGTVKISVTGTGDNAIYTILIDCTLENGGIVKGIYRGTLKWYDLT